MIRALLLDVGGVMVAPPTGDWLLGPDYREVLGDDFARERLERFRQARGALLHMLPDANVVADDDAEYAMFIPYYEAALAAADIAITRAQAERMAYMQVYRDDRYTLFADVLPWLDAWRGRLRLGIVSDAPPSTRRILDTMGVMGRVDGATFSSQLGVLKPDPAIYRATLDQLGIGPGDAVFVDDIAGNLRGAQALGMRAVQMRRDMPEHFAAAPAWDGPIAHSFAELDAILRAMDAPE